ncbi:MAG: hypothetical protein NVS2B17_06910 [Candidatus Velthaea sp.]
MKRLGLFALFALAVFVAISGMPANALQSLKTYKELVLTIVVTPSPAPVVFLHRNRNRSLERSASLTADPYRGPARLASADSTIWDTPQLGPVRAVALATPQGNIPVKFNAQPDPNAAYLKILYNTSTLTAGYGSNTYTCPFQIYAYYTTTWKVTDWGYGTSTSGTGTFPVLNYPTPSYLAWDLPDIGKTTFSNYANSGSPGELTFSGSAGVSQQHCLNLSLNVPSSQPAGSYTATIQYNLIVN